MFKTVKDWQESSDVMIKKICGEVEAEYQMGGLSDGVYGDFVKEVAIRYATFLLKKEKKRKRKLSTNPHDAISKLK